MVSELVSAQGLGANMAKVVVCKGCGEEKEHRAKGLCNACYIQEYRKYNPRDRVSDLKRKLEYAREEGIVATLDALESKFTEIGFTCSFSYWDGGITIDVQGNVYKVVVE